VPLKVIFFTCKYFSFVTIKIGSIEERKTNGPNSVCPEIIIYKLNLCMCLHAYRHNGFLFATWYKNLLLCHLLHFCQRFDASVINPGKFWNHTVSFLAVQRAFLSITCGQILLYWYSIIIAFFGPCLLKRLQKVAAQIIKVIFKEVVIATCQKQIFDVGWCFLSIHILRMAIFT